MSLVEFLGSWQNDHRNYIETQMNSEFAAYGIDGVWVNTNPNNELIKDLLVKQGSGVQVGNILDNFSTDDYVFASLYFMCQKNWERMLEVVLLDIINAAQDSGIWERIKEIIMSMQVSGEYGFGEEDKINYPAFIVDDIVIYGIKIGDVSNSELIEFVNKYLDWTNQVNARGLNMRDVQPTLSLIGEVTSWSDDIDFSLGEDGNYHLSLSSALSGGWKLRVNHEWDINLGFEGATTPVIAVNTYVKLVHNGSNFLIPQDEQECIKELVVDKDMNYIYFGDGDTSPDFPTWHISNLTEYDVKIKNYILVSESQTKDYGERFNESLSLVGTSPIQYFDYIGEGEEVNVNFDARKYGSKWCIDFVNFDIYTNIEEDNVVPPGYGEWARHGDKFWEFVFRFAGGDEQPHLHFMNAVYFSFGNELQPQRKALLGALYDFTNVVNLGYAKYEEIIRDEKSNLGNLHECVAKMQVAINRLNNALRENGIY